MDYSADEIQWIIKNQCMVDDDKLVDFIKSNFDNLIESTTRNGNVWYSKGKGTDFVFYYDNFKNKFYMIPRSDFSEKLYNKFGKDASEIYDIVVPYICEKYNLMYSYRYS